ncbi:porin [Caballeronia sp. LjRoot34]|uniref:porin n=1 Tax=Caballeronia sp. LjRoot34 TaxID=3342325 RepID=UPI003ECEE9DD
MKTSTCTLALLSLSLVASAHAQSSVTLYGDVDLGIQYLTHAGSGGERTIGLQSGNEQPSRFGITGTEDLGEGYAAVFKLESGFNLGTGNYTIPGTPFDRYAYVGLSTKNFGTVTLGRQRSILFEQSLFYDPTYLAEYSSQSTNYIPVSSLNQNNSVKWSSPVYSGFSSILMYGFGQQVAGNATAGRFTSGALLYENNSFGAHVVFEQSRGSVTTSADLSSEVDRRVNAALRYSIGAATVYGGYTDISGDLHLSPAGYTYYGGLQYRLSPALALIGEAAHYHTNDNQGQPTWFIAGATYSISKRTSLYAYGGVLKNHGGTSFTLNTYDFNSPGGFDQTGVMIGLNQLF